MNTIPRSRYWSWYFVHSVWVLMVLAGGGCSLGTDEAINNTPGEDIPILWQKTGTYSRFQRPARILVMDAATLAQVPVTEFSVDFQNQMVLIAALGPTTSSQTAVRISRIWREGHQLRVQEQRIYPSPDSEQDIGNEPASPWAAVAIPRSELNVQGYSAKIPPNLMGEHAGAR